MGTFIQGAITVYLVFAFINFVMCAPHLHLAYRVRQRLDGGTHRSHFVYLIVLPFALAIISFLSWPKRLRETGFRFFLLDPWFPVARVMIEALRDERASRGI